MMLWASKSTTKTQSKSKKQRKSLTKPLHIKGLIGGSHTLLNQKELTMKKLTKIATAGVLGLIGASNANAAVTFTAADGFSGEIDLTFFYSAVPLVVVAMVAVAAVGLGIKMFRRV